MKLKKGTIPIEKTEVIFFLCNEQTIFTFSCYLIAIIYWEIFERITLIEQETKQSLTCD